MTKSRKQLHDQLWAGATQARANSSLKLNEISEPILGLIFLKFADVRFKRAKKEVEAERAKQTSTRKRPITADDYKSRGVMFVPEEATYSSLLNLKEGDNIGKAINKAMKLIEEQNRDLAGVLPQNYTALSKKVDENNKILISLLKNFNDIPDDIEGDALGEIYEYFLGNFALSEGQDGGEFFTAQSIVRLLVEVIEPYHGRIFDPACGSGGMFVHSANFVAEHMNGNKDVMNEVAIYGQEKTSATVNIAKMNLAIHGLSGNIKESNSYYDDVHQSIGKFDFVLANPPFNVKGKDKRGQTVIDPARIKNDKRYYLGLPTTQKGEITNANYLWMQMFASALNDKGRAGFVMANSASDAGNAEKEIRQKLVDSGMVDVIIAVGGNMFLNVTLSATLWFFDKSKRGTEREKKILFLNVHDIFTPVPGDRTKRFWTDEQIDEMTGIVRSYRGEKGYPKYKDIDGRCKVATLDEVRENGYSLNPGRYVEIIEAEMSAEDFEEAMKKLSGEFDSLTDEAHKLEKKIKDDWKKIL
jgi:type I restriction enzyme M protein